ncbi:MAG: winged helix-turn-helix domain-containing protein [Acidobacteria bacterium]|nr:winged helix-turn-helix domain-containing protein [Acidobacteriota bacterium]
MRHRGWTYIDIAAGVLRRQRKPLSPEEMVNIATEDGILRSTANTPASAMRARLSSDLRTKGFESTFQRVGPNRFALREWECPEYFAPPFKKRLPDEDVVCVPQEALSLDGCGFGIRREWRAIEELLERRETLTFEARRVAEYRDDIRQLVVYVVLRDHLRRVVAGGIPSFGHIT